MTLSREITCSPSSHAVDTRRLVEHSVDAVANRQAVFGRFQVNVARARLQRVVQCGVDDLDRRAGLLRRAGERNLLDRAASGTLSSTGLRKLLTARALASSFVK